MALDVFSFYIFIFRFPLHLMALYIQKPTSRATASGTMPNCAKVVESDAGAPDKLCVAKTKLKPIFLSPSEVFRQFCGVTGSTSAGSAKVISTH